MKTIKYLTNIILALLVLYPFTCLAGIEADVNRVNMTIHIYNPADVPPALPVISIVFTGLPEANEKKVSEMQKEITEAFSKAGGIFNDEDYKGKLSDIVVNYAVRIVDSKAHSVNILFPRKKQGILMYKQK